MVSEDKIIRQGIRQTDAWFNQFKKRIVKDLSLCNTYQEFLERTDEYTTGNILVNSGYSVAMENIIVQMLNNIRFERASQRELIEETIRNNVANLIQDVGEDVKNTIRDIVSKGYDEGLHPYEIGRRISKEIDTINSKRARTIARTEVKRTDTIANYVIAKEKGAVGFTVKCRPDCCPLCAKEYAEITGEDYENLTDGDGKPVDPHLIGGEKDYLLTDIDILPPLHPNCRCTVYYNY